MDLSQPVGDSFWGKKPGGEQREGRLPRLAVRKLIKLLAYCEGVRVEEWVEAHPGKQFCSFRAGCSFQSKFSAKSQKKADEGFLGDAAQSGRPIDRPLFSYGSESTREKAIPEIPLQLQSLCPL